MWRRAGVFLLFIVLLMGVVLLPGVERGFVMPLTAMLASLSGKMVLLFDSNVLFYGNVLRNSQTGVGVAILPGCNAVEACIILIAGILAFPASWTQRAAGILIGVLVVQAVNLLRIISLFYLAQWNTFWFEIAHIYLWQLLIMLDALVFWMLWVRYVMKAHKGKVDSTGLRPRPLPQSQ